MVQDHKALWIVGLIGHLGTFALWSWWCYSLGWGEKAAMAIPGPQPTDTKMLYFCRTEAAVQSILKRAIEFPAAEPAFEQTILHDQCSICNPGSCIQFIWSQCCCLFIASTDTMYKHYPIIPGPVPIFGPVVCFIWGLCYPIIWHQSVWKVGIGTMARGQWQYQMGCDLFVRMP